MSTIEILQKSLGTTDETPPPMPENFLADVQALLGKVMQPHGIYERAVATAPNPAVAEEFIRTGSQIRALMEGKAKPFPRWFTDGMDFWKAMSDDSIFFRSGGESDWDDSVCSLKDLADLKEIELVFVACYQVGN